MRKLLIVSLALALAGCVMAPQTISLSEQIDLDGKTAQKRDALVRVIDQRQVSKALLGNRGGRSPEKSPVFSKAPLEQTLTKKLQNSLAGLGFGQNSEQEPVKVQMDIQVFKFSCNKGFVVNECSISMRFLVTVIDGNTTFKKPYGINEMRSVAASPIAEYNEKWMNEALDRVWSYMLEDKDLKSVLAIR